MTQSKISKPIHVILDGDNYSFWAQGMCSFLKGRKLWLYVTGQRHPPKQQKDETEDAFTLLLSQLIPSSTSLLLLIPHLMSLLQPILPSTSLLSLPLL